MPWHLVIYDWFLRASLSSLLVLLVGTGSVLCVRQPARRIRLIELTIVGCLVVPWLGLIPGYPRLSVQGWPAMADRTPVRSDSLSLPATPGRDAFSMEQAVPFDATDNGYTRAHTGAAIRSKHADVRMWIVTAYFAGVGAMGFWWVIGTVGLVRMLRSARPASHACKVALRRLAGDRSDRVALLESKQTEQAFTFAWFPPVIVLPAKLCHAADTQSLPWCLAHEWAHVLNRDTWSWLLANVARLIFFFQPLLWWLRGQLRLCQDYLADAQAAQQSAHPEDYAEFLAHTVSTSMLNQMPIGLGIAGQRSVLYRRVIMLVQDQFALEDHCSHHFSLSTALAGGALVSLISALGAPTTVVADKPLGARAEFTTSAEADETDNGGQALQTGAGHSDTAIGQADPEAVAALAKYGQVHQWHNWPSQADLTPGIYLKRNEQGEVIHVLSQLPLPDEALDAIAKLTWHKELILNSSIDDFVGPAITLENSQVTDLDHLRNLSFIAHFGVPGNKAITNDDLTKLQSLKRLRSLDLSDTNIADAGMESVKNVDSLIFLELSGCDITDAGLEQLKGLKSLRALLLYGNLQITNAGLANVKGLVALEWLAVTAPGVGNEGLQYVAHLRNLKILQLLRTRITDDGLRHLRNMTHLQSLALTGAHIGDAGLAHLKNMNLTAMSLDRTNVTGAGLAYLSGLPSLEFVSLEATPIGDGEVVQLAQLRNLKRVNLGGTKITNEGIKALKQALPSCEIHSTPSLFERLDNNDDGTLTGDELADLPERFRMRLTRADTNGDGAITKQELQANSDQLAN